MATQWVRCKSCGFVMEEHRLGEVCPACGVKKIMFAPDTEKISDKRRRLLELHIHPVMVHFPQAFTVTMFVMAALTLLLRGRLGEQTVQAMTVLALVQPFVVIGAFLTGLIDGKTRFRKVTTPMLRIKIVMGTALFMLSVAGFVVALRGLGVGGVEHLLFVALNFCGTICIALLGKVGAGLMNARFPG